MTSRDDVIEMLRNLPRALAAFLWRTLLFRTKFVVVTGSLGKTTAKDCLAAILATAGPTVKTEGNSNGRTGITKTLLRVRPWHRYAVIETGTDRPGGLIRASFLIRPHAALILCVARTHSQAFRNLDKTAAEKASLLRFLRPGGVAVLNADDERVAAMAPPARCHTVTFGLSDGTDVRASEISSQWPDRLSLTVSDCSGRQRIQTRLVGSHWTNSVLGAIATARALGAGLPAAAAIEAVQPYSGRMSPSVLPGGAVMLRDEYNGSVDSFHEAIKVLRNARAKRRILVMTDCSDFQRKPRVRMKYYGKLAREAADLVVFIGDRCDYGVARAQREGMSASQAFGCVTIEDAASLLRREIRPGDLILLRGRSCDQLARLYFRLLGSVGCTRAQCRLRILCEDCPKLGFQPDEHRATTPR